jgi:hypothetical protein
MSTKFNIDKKASTLTSSIVISISIAVIFAYIFAFEKISLAALRNISTLIFVVLLTLSVVVIGMVSSLANRAKMEYDYGNRLKTDCNGANMLGETGNYRVFHSNIYTQPHTIVSLHIAIMVLSIVTFYPLAFVLIKDKFDYKFKIGLGIGIGIIAAIHSIMSLLSYMTFLDSLKFSSDNTPFYSSKPTDRVVPPSYPVNLSFFLVMLVLLVIVNTIDGREETAGTRTMLSGILFLFFALFVLEATVYPKLCNMYNAIIDYSSNAWFLNNGKNSGEKLVDKTQTTAVSTDSVQTNDNYIQYYLSKAKAFKQSYEQSSSWNWNKHVQDALNDIKDDMFRYILETTPTFTGSKSTGLGHVFALELPQSSINAFNNIKNNTKIGDTVNSVYDSMYIMWIVVGVLLIMVPFHRAFISDPTRAASALAAIIAVFVVILSSINIYTNYVMR